QNPTVSACAVSLDRGHLAIDLVPMTIGLFTRTLGSVSGDEKGLADTEVAAPERRSVYQVLF
ncbi:MAG: hypothetical protein VX700_03585, partial [Pseudomonadota bacterium]|nr:hypothetical protein [Pseudomonadota bacterium]